MGAAVMWIDPPQQRFAGDLVSGQIDNGEGRDVVARIGDCVRRRREVSPAGSPTESVWRRHREARPAGSEHRSRGARVDPPSLQADCVRRVHRRGRVNSLHLV